MTFVRQSRPVRLRHPRKRPIWWMNGPSAFAIHQNAPFGGRTALLPSPSTKTPHLVDERPFCHRHPRKCPIWWMAIIPNSGPFGLESISPDGRPLEGRTFRAGGHFPGRSPSGRQDLPGRRPFSRTVTLWKAGPSGLEVIFPDGRPLALSVSLMRGGWKARQQRGSGD